MRKIIILGSMFAVVLMSCGETDTDETTTYPNYVPATIAPPQVADSMPAPQVPIQMTRNTPQAAPSASVRINPPHGQPGHSCDVEVGAPLPAAGASVTPATGASPMMVPNQGAPVAQPAPLPPPMQLNLNASGSTVKLNPAHGQPGHRCEIAVGAPLN